MKINLNTVLETPLHILQTRKLPAAKQGFLRDVIRWAIHDRRLPARIPNTCHKRPDDDTRLCFIDLVLVIGQFT